MTVHNFKKRMNAIEHLSVATQIDEFPLLFAPSFEGLSTQYAAFFLYTDNNGKYHISDNFHFCSTIAVMTLPGKIPSYVRKYNDVESIFEKYDMISPGRVQYEKESFSLDSILFTENELEKVCCQIRDAFIELYQLLVEK